MPLTYNREHNILKLCWILVQVPFATNKLALDIKYRKHCIRVVSGVGK